MGLKKNRCFVVVPVIGERPDIWMVFFRPIYGICTFFFQFIFEYRVNSEKKSHRTRSEWRHVIEPVVKIHDVNILPDAESGRHTSAT